MSLHPLFQSMASAKTEAELRFRLMDNLKEYFGVQRWGIYLADEENNLISCDVRGVSDKFVERYQKELWISHNTVKQALKKMFRKLNVTSRVEMVMRLRD